METSIPARNLVQVVTGTFFAAMLWMIVKPFTTPLYKIPGECFKDYLLAFYNFGCFTSTNAIEKGLRLRQKYGGIVRVYGAFGANRLYITDPKLIRHISISNASNWVRPMNDYGIIIIEKFFGKHSLLSATGKKHSALRKLFNPSFNNASVRGMTSSIVSQIEVLLEHWHVKLDGLDNDITPFPIQDDVSLMALGVLCAIGFGIPGNPFRDDESFHFRNLDLFTQAATTLMETPWKIVFSYYNIPMADTRAMNESIRALNNAVDALIQRKRMEGEESTDLLNSMTKATDQHSDVSDDQLRDHMKTMFIAGFETTAATMSWSLLALAKHQQVQDKLRQEILSTISSVEDITWDVVESMEYLDCVVKECIRLWPAFTSTTRMNLKDDYLDGYFIPANTMCFIPIAVCNRLEENYSNAQSFIPERFYNQGSGDWNKCLSFFVGKTRCIGEKLAIYEMKLLFIMLMRRFRLSCVPGKEFVKHAVISLRSEPPIELYVSNLN